MSGEIFGTVLVMVSLFGSGVLVGVLLHVRYQWGLEDKERSYRVRHAQERTKEIERGMLGQAMQSCQPTKRHFVVRADGWVRHDGGNCPIPSNTDLELVLRGMGSLYEDRAGQVPETWWKHDVGRYAVLWFRAKNPVEYRPRYPVEGL